MDRYWVGQVIGHGTYGTVMLAQDSKTGEQVAIKKMKKRFATWEECLQLREVKALRVINHPNVIRLREVLREKDVLYLVFEHMSCNLYEVIKDRETPFSEKLLRSWFFQVLRGLAAVHKQGFFHRDLKPENLLLGGPDFETLKIADFGLAREVESAPPYTEYISTRWYRAPEVLLRGSYSIPTDIWAVGAIVAEVFSLRPLFPGRNEADQLMKIAQILGTPTQSNWPDGKKLTSKMRFSYARELQPAPLDKIIPFASPNARQLIADMISYAPSRRPTAEQAMQYPFFTDSLAVQRNVVSAVPDRYPEILPERPAAAQKLNTATHFPQQKAHEQQWPQNGGKFAAPMANGFPDRWDGLNGTTGQLDDRRLRAQFESGVKAGSTDGYHSRDTSSHTRTMDNTSQFQQRGSTQRRPHNGVQMNAPLPGQSSRPPEVYNSADRRAGGIGGQVTPPPQPTNYHGLRTGTNAPGAFDGTADHQGHRNAPVESSRQMNAAGLRQPSLAPSQAPAYDSFKQRMARNSASPPRPDLIGSRVRPVGPGNPRTNLPTGQNAFGQPERNDRDVQLHQRAVEVETAAIGAQFVRRSVSPPPLAAPTMNHQLHQSAESVAIKKPSLYPPVSGLSERNASEEEGSARTRLGQSGAGGAWQSTRGEIVGDKRGIDEAFQNLNVGWDEHQPNNIQVDRSKAPPLYNNPSPLGRRASPPPYVPTGPKYDLNPSQPSWPVDDGANSGFPRGSQPGFAPPVLYSVPKGVQQYAAPLPTETNSDTSVRAFNVYVPIENSDPVEHTKSSDVQSFAKFNPLFNS
mmetsp:Transcript_25574/g.100979  ORF Transcript_25574/g.100979 Transcript_25574/m.100979 type:complete len:801 (-) Transcript_25574:700-3102(-)